MTTIVEVQNLSKKYLIGHERQNPYGSLKETITNGAKRLFQKLTFQHSMDQEPSHTTEEFWALNDVSVKIQEGDRVALLGRNGAGKSTFLKLLSRITEPTRGLIRIRGRVSSLLEVGTGFHPELTGRENILLNGAIMGMSYGEIEKNLTKSSLLLTSKNFWILPLNAIRVECLCDWVLQLLLIWTRIFSLLMKSWR